VAGADPAYVLITILHTNDLHGSVAPGEGPGGLARAATVVRQIRAEMPNVLLLEGGDVIHGQPEDYLSGGAATISAMNAVGYDVMTAGNHEFDFGLQVTQDAMRRASFPFLAANIRAASGGQWDRLQPHIIKEIQGVRVAIFGLATLDTITLHWPPSISDIFIDDPIETAKRVVPELRKQADVVIALSHMGVNPDKQMAAEVPGIDFIVGAHTHTTIPEWTWIGDTLVTQTGYGARNLGRIDFIVRKDGDSADLRSVNGRHTLWNNLQNVPLDASYPEGPLIAIAEDLPEDPDVLKAYQPYRDRAAALAREIMIPAVVEVGERFGRKEYFLPQLIASGETMKLGMEALEPFLQESSREAAGRGTILIATVKGDIHDIGKNIVALMLRNHGFRVVDLGRDVAAERIVREIERHRPRVVGLSALMTTTMTRMEEVIDLARRQGQQCPFIVGGAVVTRTYADSIGAEYARDGVEAVQVIQRIIGPAK